MDIPKRQFFMMLVFELVLAGHGAGSTNTFRIRVWFK
jgi:hypothetical protein